MGLDLNKRIALCIGNSTHSSAKIDFLPNAAKDATLIDATLRARGFDSELLTDASYESIGQGLERLKAKADGSGGVFSVIYFAGHGYETGGLGFLVPSDQPGPVNLSGIVQWGLSTLSLVDALAGCSGPKLIILDACRADAAEGAHPDDLVRFSDKARQLKERFQGVLDSGDVVFAFATGAGESAGDGLNGHSRYCEALASGLLSHDYTLDELLASVTQKVIRESHVKQRPWYLSSLTYPVSLSDLPSFHAVPYEVYRVRSDQAALRIYPIVNGDSVYSVDRVLMVAYRHERRKFKTFDEEIATMATSGCNVYVLLKSGQLWHANICTQSADEFELIHEAAFEDFHAMAVSPNGSFLAIGGMEGYEVIRCDKNGWSRHLKQKTPSRNNIYNVKFLDDDRLFLALCRSVWNATISIRSGRRERVIGQVLEA